MHDSIRTQLWLRPYSGSHILSRRCSGKGCDTKNVQSTLRGNQQVDNVDGQLTKLIACEISVFVNFYISSHRQRKIKHAFHLGKKTPEISVGAKVEFPTGKKLFHSVVNPARYVEVPNRGPASVQTTRNVQTKNEVPFGNSNRENRPIFLNFPLFLGIFQWNEPANETCSIYRRTENSRNFD